MAQRRSCRDRHGAECHGLVTEAPERLLRFRGNRAPMLAADVWTSIMNTMGERRRPGEVRDAILEYLRSGKREATVAEIRRAVADRVGDVPASSVRSYLNLNTGTLFERTGRGRYRLRG